MQHLNHSDQKDVVHDDFVFIVLSLLMCSDTVFHSFFFHFGEMQCDF
jgi:hypothetical protein